MTIWLTRAGSHGEYELKFIQENRVYVTWDGFKVDLGNMKAQGDLVEAFSQGYDDAKPKRITNWAYPFIDPRGDDAGSGTVQMRGWYARHARSGRSWSHGGGVVG